MARPGILVNLYDDLQHWRYNDPIKEAELMNLRFVKPINLNRQMVVSKHLSGVITGCQGKIVSGYTCNCVEQSAMITYGNITWSVDRATVAFEDDSLYLIIFCDAYYLKKSKTSPELRYRSGNRYYEVRLAIRWAKIRCPVLNNPVAYLLEASNLY